MHSRSKVTVTTIALILAFSLMSMAGDKKKSFTFLDTLNKGKELSISNADFGQPASPPAGKTAEAPSVDTSKPEPKQEPKLEAGTVASLFRIQVLASTHQDQVNREKNTLASKIDVPVSVSFEPPYYKLFAGEFAQRGDAENYLAQVKKLGYNDAWISRKAASRK